MLFLLEKNMFDDIKKEYLDRMKKYLGDDYDRYINTFSEAETHGFVLNKKRLKASSIDIDYVIKTFDAKIFFENDNIAYLVYDKEKLSTYSVQVGKHPLHHAGLYYIQEPSAAKVLYDNSITESDVVLDMCASPGGKSVMALCDLNEDKGGFIISNEIDYARSKILVSNIERMGFENVIVTCNNSQDLKLNFTNFFDTIIIDAPCSGEGMMRKSKMARLQWSTNLVQSMSNTQKKLIDDAYSMLKAGGTIIYSTCTFSQEEDEGIANYAITKYSDLKLINMQKIYPFAYPGEGQFYAVLKKDGEKSFITNFPSKSMISNLNVVKYKVNEYEEHYNTLVPSHATTHIERIIFDNIYELNDMEVIDYLHGDVIRSDKDIVDGYYKMTYKKLGLGLAKCVKNVFKNHYPKGLRNI